MKTEILLATLVLSLAPAAPARDGNTLGNYAPLEILRTVEPAFPANLAGELTGTARVAINVDEEGRLRETLVLGYSTRPFANAALEAVTAWQFRPARLDGQPVPAVAEIAFDFEARGVVVSLCGAESLEAGLFGPRRNLYPEYALIPVGAFDQPPGLVSPVAPVYPASLARAGVSGRVTVVFFVDDNGAVRMPAVSQADDYRLAGLAVDAVRQWRFTPPTRRGNPGAFRACQVFHFRPETRTTPTPARG